MQFIEKIYVIHFEPLIERKKYLDGALNSFNIPYEYVINNLQTDTDIKNNIDKYYKHDTSVLKRGLELGELSVSISHLNVYRDILKKKLNYCLIIEDDAIFDELFKQKIDLIIQEKEDFDFIFLSTCCNLNITKKSEKFLYESKTSRCTTGYIVNSVKLDNVLENSKQISLPIDTHLNYLKNIMDLKYAWCQPPIITQGSENVYKSNLR